MAEHLEINNGTKAEKYETLLPQIEAVVNAESDPIANMANVAAMLHETFGFWWTGFYRVIDGELVLGPFQGPLACTRIRRGRGVCGTAWAEAKTQVVPDVELFPGHIACSSASKSEIVVPLWQAGEVIGVLDIDSAQLATFDETDRYWLERVAACLTHSPAEQPAAEQPAEQPAAPKSEYERFVQMQMEQFEDDITEGRCYPEMPEGLFVRSK